MTGLIGSFGTAALRGYGIGVRLKYMVAPLAFGIGTGLTTLVGVAAGAGNWQRPDKVGSIGALVLPSVPAIPGDRPDRWRCCPRPGRASSPPSRR